MTFGANPSYGVYQTQSQEIETGHLPLVTKRITILGGQGVLPRGSVLGRISLTKKYVLSAKLDAEDEAIADGSEVPRGVLPFDVDTTEGDVNAALGVHGEWIGPALTYGKGHTMATVAEAWEAVDAPRYLANTLPL